MNNSTNLQVRQHATSFGAVQPVIVGSFGIAVLYRAQPDCHGLTGAGLG